MVVGCNFLVIARSAEWTTRQSIVSRRTLTAIAACSLRPFTLNPSLFHLLTGAKHAVACIPQTGNDVSLLI